LLGARQIFEEVLPQDCGKGIDDIISDSNASSGINVKEEKILNQSALS